MTKVTPISSPSFLPCSFVCLLVSELGCLSSTRSVQVHHLLGSDGMIQNFGIKVLVVNIKQLACEDYMQGFYLSLIVLCVHSYFK